MSQILKKGESGSSLSSGSRTGSEIKVDKIEQDELGDVEQEENLSFELLSSNVEEIIFMNEGTLMVLTSALEMRVLYTEYFQPYQFQPKANPYDAEALSPVLEQDIFLEQVVDSEYGAKLHQTFKLFKGLILVITD